MQSGRKNKNIVASKTVNLSNHPLPVSKFAKGNTIELNNDPLSGEESRLGLIDESTLENAT